MSDGRKYYCMCDSNCKFETMTKEQILAAIAQAAETGLVFDADAAFVTKVKESNAGGYITFWVGTQAQYNAIAEKEPNCFYHITDSTKDEYISKAVEKAFEAIACVVDMRDDVDKLRKDVTETETTVNDIRDDVDGMRKDIAEASEAVETEINDIRDDVNSVVEDVIDVRDDVNVLRASVEDTRDDVDELRATLADFSQPTSFAATKASNIIQLTISFDNGTESKTYIHLDANDYPTTIVTDGVEYPVTWEGF